MENPFQKSHPKKYSRNLFVKFVFFCFVGLFLFSCASPSGSFTRPTKINGISFLSQRSLPDSTARVPESKRPRVIDGSSETNDLTTEYGYGYMPENFGRHLMILLLLNVFQAFIIAVMGWSLIKRRE